MADDPHKFRGPPEPDDDGPDAAGGATKETQPVPPGAAETQVVPPGPAQTQPVPPGAAETQVVPPGPAETQVIRPGSAQTRATTRPGPAEETRAAPTREPAWAGRAEVPVRRAYDPGAPTPTDWSYSEEQDGRRWWLPILVGVIGLVLLAVLLVAGWVIVDSVRRGTPGPPTATPSAATSGATSAPTSAPPTTAAPTTPSATPATAVSVPPLVGLPESAAIALLEQLGLTPELRFEPSDEPAGTVLATEPEEGAEVTPGDVVVLVIAEPEPPTPPATTGAVPTAPTGPTPNG
ncbi:PASTA domain-containing protein [Plantactinospora sonchi]|uniref:PASTA domain-containing protein n=1 Tax=Plantactinospora sonchi TaxID=1544735 RepID=A0ABU7RPX8_9ACTN